MIFVVIPGVVGLLYTIWATTLNLFSHIVAIPEFVEYLWYDFDWNNLALMLGWGILLFVPAVLIGMIMPAIIIGGIGVSASWLWRKFKDWRYKQLTKKPL